MLGFVKRKKVRKVNMIVEKGKCASVIETHSFRKSTREKFVGQGRGGVLDQKHLRLFRKFFFFLVFGELDCRPELLGREDFSACPEIAGAGAAVPRNCWCCPTGVCGCDCGGIGLVKEGNAGRMPAACCFLASTTRFTRATCPSAIRPYFVRVNWY